MTASAQKQTFEGFEPANTTPVPDILFDELLADLSGAELKVLLYIIRRTRGFKKDSDAISLTQFQKGITKKTGEALDKGCGIKDRQTIIDALADLEAKGCIQSEKGKTANGDNTVTLYRIRFRSGVVGKSNQGSRKIQPPQFEKPTTVVDKSNQGVVGKSNPQDTVIQETDSQDTVIQESIASIPKIQETKLTPSWIVAKSEELRGKAYSEKARQKELEASKKLLANIPDLAESDFINVFKKRNDDWWNEHVGILGVSDLVVTPHGKSDIRFIQVLDQLAREPTLKIIRGGQTSNKSPAKTFSSYDDPEYRGASEFYPSEEEKQARRVAHAANS